MSTYSKQLKEWDRSAKELHNKWNMFKVDYKTAVRNYKELQEKLNVQIEAQKIAQEVAVSLQEVAHKQAAAIVTKCLQIVFGDAAYSFRFLFEQKRGKTETRMIFCRDGQEIDPLDAAGGGVVDVASFGLRLAAISLSREFPRPLLIMDEPFKFVSADRREFVASMLMKLSWSLGIQMIIVTHMEELMVGKVVDLRVL